MKHSHLQFIAAAMGAAFSSGAFAQQARMKLPSTRCCPRSPSVAANLATNCRSTPPSSTGSRLGLTPRETPASVTIIERDLIEKRGATDTQGDPVERAGPDRCGAAGIGRFGQLSRLRRVSAHPIVHTASPSNTTRFRRGRSIAGSMTGSKSSAVHSTFLFGAGAVGGSINYITKLAHRDGNDVQARASYGSYDTSMLGVGVNGRLGSGEGVRNYARADVSRTYSTGWVEGNKREAWNLAASLLTDVNAQLSHTLAVEYQNEKGRSSVLGHAGIAARRRRIAHRRRHPLQELQHGRWHLRTDREMGALDSRLQAR